VSECIRELHRNLDGLLFVACIMVWAAVAREPRQDCQFAPVDGFLVEGCTFATGVKGIWVGDTHERDGNAASEGGG
jgi:hypothetical protein